MIEVKLPASAKELRIKHFSSMSSIPETGFNNEADGLVFLATFLGLRYKQVLDFKLKDIRKMLNLALKSFSQMDLKSPLPKSIMLGKQEFYLVNPDKAGIGWHIDFNGTSIHKDPVRLACLFYLPKGFSYSDEDENGNITHPIASRQELFEKEFPLDLFIRAANFFLKRSLISKRKLMVVKIAQSKAKSKTSLALRVLNPFSGKRALKR